MAPTVSSLRAEGSLLRRSNQTGHGGARAERPPSNHRHTEELQRATMTPFSHRDPRRSESEADNGRSHCGVGGLRGSEGQP